MTDTPFRSYLREEEPSRGIALPVAPGITRMVANNPTVSTYWGTNTYLIEDEHGVTVIDPGPEDPVHHDALVAVTEGRVDRILLTHCHRDHRAGAPALKATTGAPVYAFGAGVEPPFEPDVRLTDGMGVAGLTVIHTPGHAPDHVCFSRGEVLFSGDHAMGWSSTSVSPPSGNMGDYIASLHRLIARDDRLLLPGHGPPVADPQAHLRTLLRNREFREGLIVKALAEDGEVKAAALADRFYAITDAKLRGMAERTVLAHLLKLEAEGRARRHGDDVWRQP